MESIRGSSVRVAVSLSNEEAPANEGKIQSHNNIINKYSSCSIKAIPLKFRYRLPLLN